MLKSIIAAVLSALLQFLGQRRDAAKQRADDRDAGALEAASRTDQSTKDIADARAEIAARPDDPDSVAERLRAKARAASGGGGGSGKT